LTFTAFLEEQSRILRDLLEEFCPTGASVIDLTFGKGRLWAEILRKPWLRALYPLTACDASPDPAAVGGVQAVKKNLFTDEYGDLGLHDVAVYDPPYCVQRVSFDYGKVSKRSWAAADLEKFTTNPSVEVFNYRVECLRQKAPTFLKLGGLLLVKVMDPRKDGRLIPHHINVVNTLAPSFDLVEEGVYVRLGASTWQVPGHLHNLHGFWLVFRLRAAQPSSQHNNTAAQRRGRAVSATPPGGMVVLDEPAGRLICGDSAVVLRTVPNESVDLTVTSPPYDDLRSYCGFTFNFEQIATALLRITKLGGVLVWVVGDRIRKQKGFSLSSFKQALFFQSIGFRVHDIMIYKKRNTPFMRSNAYTNCFEFMFVLSKGTPKTFHPLKEKTVRSGFEMLPANRKADGSFHKVLRELKQEKTKTNIWEYAVGLGGTTNDKIAFQHPAVFPEKLAEDQILSWSNEGDLVLDPMCGSGTTCKMAKLLGRQYLGIEISPEYCEIARCRISSVGQPQLDSHMRGLMSPLLPVAIVVTMWSVLYKFVKRRRREVTLLVKELSTGRRLPLTIALKPPEAYSRKEPALWV
jgi:DNA modification methylase